MNKAKALLLDSTGILAEIDERRPDYIELEENYDSIEYWLYKDEEEIYRNYKDLIDKDYIIDLLYKYHTIYEKDWSRETAEVLKEKYEKEE